MLLDAYPAHSILAEESGAAGKSEFQWIIDPLDGTTNFLHGFPQYAVSIALSHKGVLTQAVIYDPVRNDLFTATRGRGAYLNDHRIRVSKRIKLQQSLIGTGFPFREFAHIDTYLAMFRDLTQKTSGTAPRRRRNARSRLRRRRTPRRLLGIRPESVGHGGRQPAHHRSRRTGRRSRRQQRLSRIGQHRRRQPEDFLATHTGARAAPHPALKTRKLIARGSACQRAAAKHSTDRNFRVITTTNLTMQFGAKPLFENVSVKFGEGNRYGLIGANGCGKSTFMKILGGDLEPSAGSVAIDKASAWASCARTSSPSRTSGCSTWC